MNPSDAEIIAASIGEPVRFAEVFDRHAAPIRRFALARVGAAVADDIAAETFRIAFEQRAAYDTGAASALPWLYGITSNLVRREMRGRARRYAALERRGAWREEPGDSVSDLASQLDARADLHELRDALATLSSDELDVLLLVAWEHLSPTDVGIVLGVPAPTVRTRLHRARQRIKRHGSMRRSGLEEATDVTR